MPEVQETEGHSPPDEPPPSMSRGPECPSPGYAKRFWTKDAVPVIDKKGRDGSNYVRVCSLFEKIGLMFDVRSFEPKIQVFELDHQ